MALAASATVAPASAQQPLPAIADRSLVPYADSSHAVRLPDGRALNLICMGEGSPTVILTAGAGDWSVTWSRVQPAVARMTRVCAWDRPGFGFSDPPARPQAVDETTSDLQAALTAGGIAGPYVLVGHSLGGYESLLFADREPGSVAGMVLIDPAFPDQLSALGKAAPAQASYMLSLPNPLTALFSRCSAAVRAGTLRAGGPDPDGCFHPPWPGHYPPELIAALDRRVAGASTEQLLAAWETMMFFGSPQLLEKDARVVVNPRRNYGAMPLTVLTRTEFQPPPDFPAAARAEIPAEDAAWNHGHDELAALSRRGINARVPGTGHYIHAARPRVVIDAIEQVVREARESGGDGNAR
jgi:pimeloyl-ACP methyl ester carboxylesterase